jgi:hypothetical protein
MLKYKNKHKIDFIREKLSVKGYRSYDKGYLSKIVKIIVARYPFYKGREFDIHKTLIYFFDSLRDIIILNEKNVSFFEIRNIRMKKLKRILLIRGKYDKYRISKTKHP